MGSLQGRSKAPSFQSLEVSSLHFENVGNKIGKEINTAQNDEWEGLQLQTVLHLGFKEGLCQRFLASSELIYCI